MLPIFEANRVHSRWRNFAARMLREKIVEMRGETALSDSSYVLAYTRVVEVKGERNHHLL